MTDKFILNEKGQPMPCDDLMKWGQWMQWGERKVGNTVVGPSRVSTVFLGLNHEYNPNLPPLLWETMVFGGPMDQEQERCSGTREQAEAMHARMVERVTSHNEGLASALRIQKSFDAKELLQKLEDPAYVERLRALGWDTDELKQKCLIALAASPTGS